MAHLVGVEISSTCIRVVTVDANFRQSVVSSAKSIAVEPGETPESLWQRVRAELPPEIESVALGVDGRVTSTRLLSFPFTDLRRLDSVIEFELESQVPYALDETATTYVVIEKGTDSTQLVVALTPKEPLLAHFAAMHAVGIEPRSAILQAGVLSELPVSGDKDITSAILSIGSVTSHLAAIRRGLRYARSLRVGGTDVDRIIARRLNISAVEAKTLKETRGSLGVTHTDPNDTALSNAISEGLGPLVTAMMSTFKTLPNSVLPQRLYITGGMSRLPGLPEYLAHKLGIPVEIIDLPRAINDVAKIPEGMVIGPEYAVAAGLVLSQARNARNTALNFRRGELAYSGDFQVYRGEIIRIGVGIAAMFFLAMIGSIVRYSMISAEEKALNAAFCQTTQKIVGREICDPTAAIATLKQAPGTAEGVAIPSYSASALLEMMSRNLGTDVDVQFEELEFRLDPTGDKINGKGEAASFEATEQIVAQLKRDPCVQSAEISKQKKTKNSGRVEFNLTVKVECPAGVIPGNVGNAQANAAGGADIPEMPDMPPPPDLQEPINE